MIVEGMSVMGHVSFTSIVTPLVFDVYELKYILWGVLFWCSASNSSDVPVLRSTAKFVHALFILLCNFSFFPCLRVLIRSRM